MKLDPDLIRYLSKDHFRVLVAIEMGMRNHEFVPATLIESLAQLKRGNCYKHIVLLLKHKLIFHTGKNYSGYALTYQGYDYLALKTFMKRGHVKKLICQIGVGKESDIYICDSGDALDADGKPVHAGEPVVIKFARLGRTSFRTIKENRDYLKGRSSTSWLYMSRLASLKEFAFMTALHRRGFATPVPHDANRHAICMSLIQATPMINVRAFSNPETVYHGLIEQIVQFAEHGLVHGDFNEFNVMVSDDEQITVIDFPQMTSTDHPNAQYYFERDVRCIQNYFTRRHGLAFEGAPLLERDVERIVDLDKEIKASGFFEETDAELVEMVGQQLLDNAQLSADQNMSDKACAVNMEHSGQITEDNENGLVKEEHLESEQCFNVDTELARRIAEDELELETDDKGKEEEVTSFVEENKSIEVKDNNELVSSEIDSAEEDSRAPAKDQSSDEDTDDEPETEAQQEWRVRREARLAKREIKQQTLSSQENQDASGTKKKLAGVNMEYVKLRARRQYKSQRTKQNQRRNNNKDKGEMKAKDDIRDCLGAVDEF